MGWIKYLFHSITKKIFIYNFYVIYFAFLFCFGGQVDIISLHPNETTMKIRHCSFLCKWEKFKFSSGWSNYFSHSIFNENLFLCESTTLTPWQVLNCISAPWTVLIMALEFIIETALELSMVMKGSCQRTQNVVLRVILQSAAYYLIISCLSDGWLWWWFLMVFFFSVILIYIKNSGYYNF